MGSRLDCLWMPRLKGDQSEDASQPESVKKCANIDIYRLYSVVLSVFVQNLFAFEFDFHGHTHVGAMFSNEERKKSGFGCIWYFCHTCRPFFYNIMDTDCWAQNDSIHSCVFGKWRHPQLCFGDFQTLIFNSRTRNQTQNYCVFLSLHSSH